MWRYVTWLLVTTSIVIVSSLVVLGWEGSVQSITFGHPRGWEIESLPANVLRLVTSGAARREAGAWRVGDGSPLVEVLLTIAQFAAVISAAWLGRRSQRYAAGWIASVNRTARVSRRAVTQFVIWLLPAAALAWVSDDRILTASVLVVAALTRLEFGGVLGIGGFGDLMAGHDAALANCQHEISRSSGHSSSRSRNSCARQPGTCRGASRQPGSVPRWHRTRLSLKAWCSTR